MCINYLLGVTEPYVHYIYTDTRARRDVNARYPEKKRTIMNYNKRAKRNENRKHRMYTFYILLVYSLGAYIISYTVRVRFSGKSFDLQLTKNQ